MLIYSKKKAVVRELSDVPNTRAVVRVNRSLLYFEVYYCSMDRFGASVTACLRAPCGRGRLQIEFNDPEIKLPFQIAPLHKLPFQYPPSRVFVGVLREEEGYLVCRYVVPGGSFFSSVIYD